MKVKFKDFLLITIHLSLWYDACHFKCRIRLCIFRRKKIGRTSYFSLGLHLPLNRSRPSLRSVCDPLVQWLARRVTDRKVSGSNPASHEKCHRRARGRGPVLANFNNSIFSVCTLSTSISPWVLWNKIWNINICRLSDMTLTKVLHSFCMWLFKMRLIFQGV